MAEAESQPAGELIVQNGKRKGTRLPLRPMTSIGSATGCDVRLSGEGVMPLHCVIGLTAAGPRLAGFATGVTLVNGSPSEEGLLVDGDEVKVGPCVFQVAWSAAVPVLPPLDTLPLEATQIAEILEDRQRQIAEHEAQLTVARAAFRLERESRLDQLDASREEMERLKCVAFEAHREAVKERDRLKKLAARFVARMRRKWHGTQQEVEFDRSNVIDARGRFETEVADFTVIRSAFYTEAAEARERLRHDWASLESYRRRAAADRTEADEYYAKQDAAIESRATELATRERSIAEARNKLDLDAAALRTEASGLEARIVNARAIVEELERKRDELQAMTLMPTTSQQAPVQFSLDRVKDRDLTAWAAELDAREQKLNDDRAAIVALKASLDTEATNIADRRRVLAEQFGLLTAARNAWQEAEGRTVDEMEELARDLRHREQQLDIREDRLMKADGRRREDAYELWQFRLRLEGWQTKLTAVERRWHSERELREAEYAQRVQQLTLREATMDAAFTKWEETHEQDREHLRIELRQWTEDRTALMRAAAEFDRQRQDMLAELVTHASRAMAAEQTVSGAIQDAGSTRAKRRLDVLRKRWERSFTRIHDEAAKRTTAATEELAQIDVRYRELLRLLNDVVGREASLNVKIARAEFAALAGLVGEVAKTIPSLTLAPIASEELVALRNEVERMAGVLLTAEMPDPLTLADDKQGPDLLPFGIAKAA